MISKYFPFKSLLSAEFKNGGVKNINVENVDFSQPVDVHNDGTMTPKHYEQREAPEKVLCVRNWDKECFQFGVWRD